MDYREIAERQTELERKVLIDDFKSSFPHQTQQETLYLFRISAAWRSIQLWRAEHDADPSTDLRSEYKKLLQYRTGYAYYEIKAADMHFNQATI